MDRVRVTTFVDVDPADAFDVFTRETDLWWRHGKKFRTGPGTIVFEGAAGGRLVEITAAGAREIGTITIWEPGARLVFDWRGANFGPHERTEVEVRFIGKNGGTEVVLEHRGWSTLPADHPVRHGADDAAFSRVIGGWWGDLLTSYRTFRLSSG